MKLYNRKGRQKWEREYKDIECRGLKKAVFKSHGWIEWYRMGGWRGRRSSTANFSLRVVKVIGSDIGGKLARYEWSHQLTEVAVVGSSWRLLYHFWGIYLTQKEGAPNHVFQPSQADQQVNSLGLYTRAMSNRHEATSKDIPTLVVNLVSLPFSTEEC